MYHIRVRYVRKIDKYVIKDTIICKIDHFVISRFKKLTTWIVILSGKNKYEQIYSLDTCTYVVRDRLFLFMLSKMYCSRNDFRFSFLFNSHSYAGWFKIQHNRVNCRICGKKIIKFNYMPMNKKTSNHYIITTFFADGHRCNYR